MPLLGSKDLHKSYGDRDILTGATVAIEVGERLGLVGVNGSGKSTLARILAGLEQADRGEVTREGGTRLGYLPQQPQMDPTSSALEVVLSGLTEWAAAMKRHAEATEHISGGGHDASVLAAQAEAASDVERLGGWELQYQAETMLAHLGIATPQAIVGAMSGGERRRVAMARVLIAQPDLAILDEPTNHLDIPTIEWLEGFLGERLRGALLLITHDRYLLDRIVTRTLELDRGTVLSYDGGWEEYLAGRAERVEQAERDEANRQNFLRRELEWVRRQPKARTGKQKARVDRAQQAMQRAAPERDQVAAIAVDSVRAGKTVLEARDVAIEIGGRRLVDGFDLTLTKGQRIGIVGPNGAGKTTLLRGLLGEHPLAHGHVNRGKNTKVAYLDQARAHLDDDQSIYDNVAQGRTHITLGEQSMEVRTYLKRFLFDIPKQGQLVGSLSGGERARVALARVLREGANLVVLDEPTNDLDVSTLGALEASLLDFGGTVLVVTHDRWFLDRVATSVLGFEAECRVVHVHGTYGDYMRWQTQARAEEESRLAASERRHADSAKAQPTTPAVDGGVKKLTYGERIELEGLMERVEAAEATVAELEAEMASAAFAKRNYEEQAAFLESLNQARSQAEELVDRWSELESRRE